MKFSRIERTAKEALELAEYVYNNRDVNFTEIIASLQAEKPHTVTFWCTGVMDVELAFYGDVCDVGVSLDDQLVDTAKGRIWRTSLENLGRNRHTLTFTAAGEATDVRLCLTAKGGMRI